MTPQQIAIVKQTWKKVEQQSDIVAQRFYARLFELDPTLRALFKNDMRAQGRMVMKVITLAVSQLEYFERLVPVVRALGERHVTYGVEERHYATVGTALLDTLAAGLKSDFTPEAKEAWSTAYSALANTMKAGSEQVTEAL
jgi:hemoglobin-like flavoprotein